MAETTTTGATRNVPLPVRQSKPKAPYLVSTMQAAWSCARPVSTLYYPKRRQSRSPRMWRHSLVGKYRSFRRTNPNYIATHYRRNDPWSSRKLYKRISVSRQRYKHVSCFQRKDLLASRFATQTSGEQPLSDKKAVSVWDQLPFIDTTVFWQYGRPIETSS